MIYLFVKQLIRLVKVKLEVNYESRKEGAEIFNCEIDLLAVLAFPCFVNKRRSGLLLDETYFGKEMVFSWDYFVEICNIISGKSV